MAIFYFPPRSSHLETNACRCEGGAVPNHSAAPPCTNGSSNIQFGPTAPLFYQRPFLVLREMSVLGRACLVALAAAFLLCQHAMVRLYTGGGGNGPPAASEPPRRSVAGLGMQDGGMLVHADEDDGEFADAVGLFLEGLRRSLHPLLVAEEVFNVGCDRECGERNTPRTS